MVFLAAAPEWSSYLSGQLNPVIRSSWLVKHHLVEVPSSIPRRSYHGIHFVLAFRDSTRVES